MYCPHCGKEHDEGISFCPYCGTKLGAAPEPEKTEEKDEFYKASPALAPAPAAQPTKKNAVALVGFILSFGGFITFLLPVAGLICSIVGLVKSKQFGNSWRGFAIAGIIISAVSIVVSITVSIITYKVYLPLMVDFFRQIFNGIFNNVY